MNQKDFGKAAEVVKHITHVGDVVKLVVKRNEDEKVGGWVCPVTGREMDEGAKFVYLVPCGHVFSESALKNVQDTQCLEVPPLLFPCPSLRHVLTCSVDHLIQRRT